MASYKYHKTIVHEGLNKSKTIAANSLWELSSKCQMQYAQWDEQWEKKQLADEKRIEAERKRKEKEQIARNNEQAVSYALKQTKEAEQAYLKLDSMLEDSLEPMNKFDFQQLKDFSDFSIPYPEKPHFIEIQREPLRTDEEFNPKPGLLVKMSSKKMNSFAAENDSRFADAHEQWERKKQEDEIKNQQLEQLYNENVKKWNNEKSKFEQEQKEKNDGIDAFKEAVSAGEKEAVENFIGLIIEKILLPIEYKGDFSIEYIPENKQIVMDVEFPDMEKIPKLKSVSYVKSKQEFKDTYYTESQIRKKYDDVIYQIVLIYLNCVFSANSYFDLIDVIVLNGIVNTIDKTTGNNTDVCILSVRESKEKFSQLNLHAIDPKAWFRSSKGVAAASIANVTPVQPIQILNKDDDRFIEGYSVIGSIDEGVNLAAIDWKDFENLISEVFGQEFNSNGGEVKITQASRDGGVDAVAFDPDPIRGGKIVIQAKRYTNVVGVSAVRDLYGTLMNEGAMKGILVTTSYFGNDAYDFANGKPLQLIDGAQLLGLLEKHGHKARINLKEAKAMMNGI